MQITDGVDNRKGRWVVPDRDVKFAPVVYTGKQIKARADVTVRPNRSCKTLGSGSGYDPVNIPFVTQLLILTTQVNLNLIQQELQMVC